MTTEEVRALLRLLAEWEREELELVMRDRLGTNRERTCRRLRRVSDQYLGGLSIGIRWNPAFPFQRIGAWCGAGHRHGGGEEILPRSDPHHRANARGGSGQMIVERHVHIEALDSRDVQANLEPVSDQLDEMTRRRLAQLNR